MLVLGALLLGAAAQASSPPMEVYELWRESSFTPCSVSTNPVDGSCWVIDCEAEQVVHIGSDGQELWRGGNLVAPQVVAVNPSDGSCWVADRTEAGVAIIRLAPDGSELWRSGYPRPCAYGWIGGSLAINASDGSCWTTDCGAGGMFEFGQDGTLLQSTTWVGPYIAVNPTDGSYWVNTEATYPGQLVHFSKDGTELYRGQATNPTSDLAVNPADGSCWTGGYPGQSVLHIAADGTLLSQTSGFLYAYGFSVNPTDGSCWVSDAGMTNNVAVGRVACLRADGTQAWAANFDAPGRLSVNSTDGSCWVADLGPTAQSNPAYTGGALVHLGLRPLPVTAPIADFSATPTSGLAPVSVSFTDASLNVPTAWSWDFGDGATSTEQNPYHSYLIGGSYSVSLTVTNYAGSDTKAVSDYVTITGRPVEIRQFVELWREESFAPRCASVNSVDGSCWVIDGDAKQVVHFAADGQELWRGGNFVDPQSLAANPDGSCWVADQVNATDVVMARLAQDGSELWRADAYTRPCAYSVGAASLSANATDGSCWLTGCGAPAMFNFALDGTETPRPFVGAFLVVNSADGSYWVVERQTWQLVHFSKDGVELWRGEFVRGDGGMAVDPTDGSVWVGEANSSNVLHLAANGSRLSVSPGFSPPRQLFREPHG